MKYIFSLLLIFNLSFANSSNIEISKDENVKVEYLKTFFTNNREYSLGNLSFFFDKILIDSMKKSLKGYTGDIDDDFLKIEYMKKSKEGIFTLMRFYSFAKRIESYEDK